jgi:2-phospho-L-lactate guanylyltransferase
MRYILIPVKELAAAKQRLCGMMTQPERTRLATLMLEHVFEQVARAKGYALVAVVTSCAPAIQAAQSRGFEIIRETEQKSESASIDYAAQFLQQRGATSVLRLPIDLPLILAEDIAAVLALMNEVGSCPSTVLVPSREGTGTNALGRTPPDLFPSHFGPDSLAKHRQEARLRNVPCRELNLPRIAFDLDTPEDVKYLLKTFPAHWLCQYLKQRKH